MLANVSPVALNKDETLSTLRYAASAKNIKTVVKKNEDPAQQKIWELTSEVEALKRELEVTRQQASAAKRLAQHLRGEAPHSFTADDETLSAMTPEEGTFGGTEENTSQYSDAGAPKERRRARLKPPRSSQKAFGHGTGTAI